MKIRGTTITTPMARSAVPHDEGVSNKPWSSKNTVDKLCPSFTESGAMVTCEPVEGYPLTVTAEEGATAITRCGKNLAKLCSADHQSIYGLIAEKQSDSFLVNGTSQIDANNIYLTNYLKGHGNWISLKKGTYTVKVAVISGTITGAQIVFATNFGTTNSNFSYVALNTASTFTMSADGICAVILQFSKNSTVTNAKVQVQIEKGNTATAFDPYNDETFAPGDTIRALPGVNNIWADTGNVTVTGKADPVAVINKLTNAIVALGGNV